MVQEKYKTNQEQPETVLVGDLRQDKKGRTPKKFNAIELKPPIGADSFGVVPFIGRRPKRVNVQRFVIIQPLIYGTCFEQ